MSILGQSLAVIGIRELWEMILALLVGRLPEPDEDAAVQQLRNLISTTSSNFLFGDFIAFFGNAALLPGGQNFMPDVSPAIGVTENLMMGARQLRNSMDPDTEGFWDAAIRLLVATSQITGQPLTATPVREFKKLYDLSVADPAIGSD